MVSAVARFGSSLVRADLTIVADDWLAVVGLGARPRGIRGYECCIISGGGLL